MKPYEAVFILDSKKFEDGGESFSRDAEKHIKSLGGRVNHRISLGRRQFARPIAKHRAGNYWDLLFELDPDQVEALHDNYRLNASVLRLEVFQHDGSAPTRDYSRPPRSSRR